MSILTVQKLRKEFSRLVAVDDVSFSVQQGQVVGLIGPNGAGKTTLLRMLATVLPPTDGTATVCGFDLKEEPLNIRKRIGYLPDFFNLYNDLTLGECLDFFAHAYSVPAEEIAERIHRSLHYVNLAEKRDSFVRHLSRGMVQRMGLAVLLVREPEIFLLDEPASGLDPIARIQLRDVLRGLSKDGKTIIISSHILTELSGFCTHIAIMNQGGLVLYGDMNEVEREFAGFRKISIKVLDDTEKAAELIRNFPDAELEASLDATLTVAVHKGPEAVAALNRHLVQNGIQVIQLFEQKTSLEDLFVKISQEKQLEAV